jgi:hypothetical protein
MPCPKLCLFGLFLQRLNLCSAAQLVNSSQCSRSAAAPAPRGSHQNKHHLRTPPPLLYPRRVHLAPFSVLFAAPTPSAFFFREIIYARVFWVGARGKFWSSSKVMLAIPRNSQRLADQFEWVPFGWVALNYSARVHCKRRPYFAFYCWTLYMTRMEMRNAAHLKWANTPQMPWRVRPENIHADESQQLTTICERQQQRLHKRFVKLCPSFMSVQRGAARRRKRFQMWRSVLRVGRWQNIYNRFVAVIALTGSLLVF